MVQNNKRTLRPVTHYFSVEIHVTLSNEVGDLEITDLDTLVYVMNNSYGS